MKSTIHSPAFLSVAHNSWVALSIQDIKDEKFWKAIYCLWRAVFSTLKTLWYCDANYSTMDKIYYLANWANDAITNLAMDFDDVDLFGPMWITEMNGIDLEMTKVFVEKLEFQRYYLYLLFLLSDFNLSGEHFLVKFQMMMIQMSMKSV